MLRTGEPKAAPKEYTDCPAERSADTKNASTCAPAGSLGCAAGFGEYSQQVLSEVRLVKQEDEVRGSRHGSGG